MNKGYVISTMKCFFTLLLYSHGLRAGEGKQYVLIKHFKIQELLLRERRRKFLGRWASWVCLACTTTENLSCLKNILVFQLQNPLGSFQSTVSTALPLWTLQKVQYGSAKNQFFQYKHPFCRKLKQKKKPVYWHVAKQQKEHMSRTIYICCISTLPFLIPSSYKLLGFLCILYMKRNYIEASFSSFLLCFPF